MTRRGNAVLPRRKRAHRRPGSLRPGRRWFTLIVALGSVLLGFPAPPAAAADTTSPIVYATIYGPGAAFTTESVSFATLQGNPAQCPAYQGPDNMALYGQHGVVPLQLSSDNTWPLSSILACLPKLTINGVTGVVVLQSDGVPESELTPHDLASPSDFADPAESPVVIEDGANLLTYERPWRGGSDLNFGDQVQDQSLTIEVYTQGANPLTVTATASNTTVTAPSIVAFTSTVSPGNESGLSYSWDFDGGAADSTLPDPQVTFATPGAYDVTLHVTDAAGDGGMTTLPITVDPSTASPPPSTASPPPSTASPPPGTGPTTQPAPGTATTPTSPTSGPAPGAGTIPRAPAGEHKQGYPKKSKRTRHLKAGTGAGHTHTAGHPQASTTQTRTSTTGTTTSTRTASTTRATSTTGATSTTAAPTSPAIPAPNATPSHHAPPRPHDPAAPASTHPAPAVKTPPASPLVTGRLISDVIALPAAASPLVRDVPAALAAAPALRRATSPSDLGLIAGTLTVFALLGLGARRELRSGRRPRAPRFDA